MVIPGFGNRRFGFFGSLVAEGGRVGSGEATTKGGDAVTYLKLAVPAPR